MRYISKYGMKMSQIGLGTGRFGTIVDKELSYKMLDMFVEGGGNVIDTARNYYEWVENGRGKSEETIGAWMQERKNRENVYISTKGGVRNEGKTFIMNLSKQALIDEIRQSMDALCTDYIDIYLLHRDEAERNVEEIVDSLQEVKNICNAKAIGVCNWSAERVRRANEYARAHQLEPIRIVQTWWSIAAYTPNMWGDSTTTYMDSEMYDYLKEYDMFGMAYTSQAKGFFQKVDALGYDNVPDFLKYRIATEENLRRLNLIQEYSRVKGVSVTSVVNGYIMQNDVDGLALVSCSKLEQLKDILENCDSEIDAEWIRQFRM